MRRRVVVRLIALLAVLLMSGCGAAEAPQGIDGAAGGFADPGLAGDCEDVSVDVSATEPGSPTRDEAVERFIAMHEVLDGTVVADEEIQFEGERVGRITVSEAPAGGYYVEHAGWCYPG